MKDKPTNPAEKKIPIKRGTNKEFLDNIIKPGECRNPNGRPLKKDCLTSLLKEELEKPCIEELQKKYKAFKGKTWKECLVIATLIQAVKGNATAMKEVWERIDGKVTQPFGLGDDENVSKIIVEFVRGKIVKDKIP